MDSSIRIQGKVVRVKPAKTGYYIVIQEQETGKYWSAFSQWKPRERAYSLVLRKSNGYFFIVGWQEIEAKTEETEPTEQSIYQPHEEKDKQTQQKLIQKLQTKVIQLQTEIQQWKNAYYNQKQMLKKAQELSQQRTVETKIKVIENKPGKKSKQDLDYLQVLTDFNRECKENWSWLNSD